MALPQCAVGWSIVRDCGISRSYSLISNTYKISWYALFVYQIAIGDTSGMKKGWVSLALAAA